MGERACGSDSDEHPDDRAEQLRHEDGAPVRGKPGAKLPRGEADYKGAARSTNQLGPSHVCTVLVFRHADSPPSASSRSLLVGGVACGGAAASQNTTGAGRAFVVGVGGAAHRAVADVFDSRHAGPVVVASIGRPSTSSERSTPISSPRSTSATCGRDGSSPAISRRRSNETHPTRRILALAEEPLRSPALNIEQRLPEPLASQLRTMVALHEDARLILAPVEVRFEPVGTGGRALLRIVLVDPRLSRPTWIGEVVSDSASAFGPVISRVLPPSSRISWPFDNARTRPCITLIERNVYTRHTHSRRRHRSVDQRAHRPHPRSGRRRHRRGTQLAGLAGVARYGDPIPDATLDSIKRTKLALKGPLETPVGEGFRSINVALRKTFDLYANVRPAYTIAPGGRYENSIS